MPYKEKIFNFSTIFNEICFCMLSCTVFAFSEIKIDQSTTSFTDFENTFGYIFMGILYFTIGVNLLYLIPSKIYEIYCIIKSVFVKIIGWCKHKVKIEAKMNRYANKSESNIQPLPNISISRNADNECIVDFVSKSKKKILERETMNLQEEQKINSSQREFLPQLKTNEEHKRPRFKHQEEIPTFDQYRKKISKIHRVGEEFLND